MSAHKFSKIPSPNLSSQGMQAHRVTRHLQHRRVQWVLPRGDRGQCCHTPTYPSFSPTWKIPSWVGRRLCLFFLRMWAVRQCVMTTALLNMGFAWGGGLNEHLSCRSAWKASCSPFSTLLCFRGGCFSNWLARLLFISFDFLLLILSLSCRHAIDAGKVFVPHTKEGDSHNALPHSSQWF